MDIPDIQGDVSQNYTYIATVMCKILLLKLMSGDEKIKKEE